MIAGGFHDGVLLYALALNETMSQTGQKPPEQVSLSTPMAVDQYRAVDHLIQDVDVQYLAEKSLSCDCDWIKFVKLYNIITNSGPWCKIQKKLQPIETNHLREANERGTEGEHSESVRSRVFSHHMLYYCLLPRSFIPRQSGMCKHIFETCDNVTNVATH
ncbi:atrial natriuretic peptide receptor 1 isoform X1 [Tachysurus ichikawai]